MAAVSAAQERPAFRSNVEIVVVPLTVVDANGAAVSGLARDVFQVYDNNVRRPIENLWVDDDQPLTLGVIIDASESQKEQLAEHRRAALELLERILRPGDRVFVISVDENVRLWADLTGSLADLRREMVEDPSEPFGHPCARQSLGLAGSQTISACGSSPLWNATADAASLKLRPLSGNKALLLLTDGFDSGSTHSWQQAAAAAIGADASV